MNKVVFLQFELKCMMYTPQTYWLTGRVAHGFKNGRAFGYPTANLIEIRPVMPLATGVYAAKVLRGEAEYTAMLYVGTRPTLSMSETTVEIHILDFNEEIYGEEIQFAIIRRIRDEKHFDSVEALIDRLKKDEKEIRNLGDKENDC